jgi:bifunctional non-homologous end joining protein LigD
MRLFPVFSRAAGKIGLRRHTEKYFAWGWWRTMAEVDCSGSSWSSSERVMPISSARSRASSRFGSPLVLSRVHWVRPELVAEVKYLTWTEDNLLRQVVYEGLREDKPAAEVRREVRG